MTGLTERQTQLLKAIVEEYVSAAEPVGSKTLVEKYKMDISPATVRNEMAALAKEGYLEQPHTSAGRIPASLGLRYYIRSLMEEESLPVLEEVSIKQRLWNERENFIKLLRSAVLSLSENTRYLAIITVDDGHVLHAGSVNILDHPEFYDIEVTRSVLNLLDRFDLISEIFSKGALEEEVNILIGGEIGLANFEPVGIVFSRYNSGKNKGVIGVVGPARLNYPRTVPLVRFFSNLLREFGGVW